MLLSGDIRAARPVFSPDSSRVHVAASGARTNVIIQVGSRTAKILSMNDIPASTIGGLASYRSDLAVGSKQGITVGKRSLSNTPNPRQLCAGLNNGLLFQSTSGVHVVRDYEVTDLPMNKYSVLAANGDFVIGADGKNFQVWCEEWESPMEFSHTHLITALAAGSGVLAVGDKKGVVTAWAILKKSLLKRAKKIHHSVKNHWHANQVNALAFIGSTILSGGEEGVLRIWYVEDQKFHNVPRLGAPIVQIVVSPDERWVAITLDNNSLVIMDTGDWQTRYAINALAPVTHGLICSSMSNYSTLCIGNNDKLTFLERPFSVRTLPLWERNYVKEEGQRWQLVCMSFSRDENVLVTCERMSMERKIYRQVMKWWRLTNSGYSLDSIVYDPHVGMIYAMVAHPMEDKFFSVCSHGVIKTWEVESSENMWYLSAEYVWREQAIDRCTIAPDGSVLGVVYSSTILLWDTETNQRVNHWSTSRGRREGFAQSAALDAQFIMPWGSNDMLLCVLFPDRLDVWNAFSGELVQEIKCEEATSNATSNLAVSPSNLRISFMSKGQAKVYKLEDNSLKIEKSIECTDVSRVSWLSNDRLALIGSSVEAVSMDDTELTYDIVEEEESVPALVQKSVDADAKTREDRHQITKGAQHRERIEQLVLPKSTPTHLLPPCKSLLRRYISAFAKKDAHTTERRLPLDHPAAPLFDTRRNTGTTGVETEEVSPPSCKTACMELGPIIDWEWMEKAFA